MGSLVPDDDYSNGDEDVSGKSAKAASAATERQAGGSMMEQLVPEITTHALSYLDYPSLCRLSMTNSSMRRAANDDNAWKMLYHKDFTLEQDNITPDKGWKAYYASTKAVVTVNAEFFNIITERSAGSMRRLWLNADYVKCILGSGQFGVSLSGYNAVMESFEMAIHWVQDEGINFEVQDVRARIAGNMAWVTMKAYVEIAGGPFHVTNVFEFHNGQWLMVHHHSSGMLVVGGMAQHQLLGLFERSTMGCVNSKSGFKMDDDFVDSFNLDPASKGEFDLNTVGESWLTASKSQSTSHVPVSLLEKVDSSLNLEPRSWSEVSKALEDLKPSIENQFPVASTVDDDATENEITRRSRKSIEKKFHTVEEVDEVKNVSPGSPPVSLSVGLLQPVRRNNFILRDKQKKQKEGSRIKKPLDGLKEMCPPGGSESVVLYTTSLHGVRRTFEDCEKARLIVELQCPLGLDIDERDVSIHGEYLREMKRLLVPVGGEEGHLTVPRLFVKGRYVGGVEEIVELNETRRLGEMLRSVRRRKGVEGGEPEFGGRKECAGCGGFRFVLCFECNGSRKVVLDDNVDMVVRCEHCNENGLEQCPLCARLSD